MQLLTANTEDEVRTDICAQRTSSSLLFSMYGCSTLLHQATADPPWQLCTDKNENEKRWAYEQRIIEIEHAWVLHATGYFSNRWHGTSRGHGIQENGISPGREEGATLLQDHGLASVCTKFLFDPLSHPVHSWHQIGQTQARQTVSGLTNWSCSRGELLPGY